MQGIQIQDKHPEIDGVLEALMSKLEQDNKKLTLSETDRDHCEAFAVNVFNRADKQDRSGKADHNTVRAFYVATVFIQVSPNLTCSSSIFPLVASMQNSC